MSRPRVVVCLLAAGLTLSACGGASRAGSTGVDYSKLGVPVPKPHGSYVTPEPKVERPGETASPSEQVLYDLQQRVVRTAGVTGRTSGSCTGGVITGTVDQTVDCTVRYEGLKVVYRVEITGGTPTFRWVATTDRSVLTAEGVGRAYWAKFGADAEVVRCDKMPAKRLVRLGEDTDYRCYHKGADGWAEHAVVLTDGAITFPSVEPN